MMKELDRQLLAALRHNARMSTSALARTLGVSRSTVQSRIQKLESEGVIQGYSVVLGDRYLEGRMRAHVLITVEQRLTPRLNRLLEGIPEIVALHAISGEFDLIVEVEADGPPALNQVLDRVSALEGILRTQTSVILETRLSR
nr:Lrp/AsnC family transcriptional regulator [Oceanococcus sp. HetDA_MAG_MS8]